MIILWIFVSVRINRAFIMTMYLTSMNQGSLLVLLLANMLLFLLIVQ
jgi:hypothetical protein